MSYAKPRLKLEMSVIEAVTAMSEGNPGAVSVLTEIIKEAHRIDPDNALNWLGPVCQMDNLDCYGSRIWMLYKDVCGCKVGKLIGVLRACQLGFVSERMINDAIDRVQSVNNMDVSILLAKVKERLPNFVIE